MADNLESPVDRRRAFKENTLLGKVETGMGIKQKAGTEREGEGAEWEIVGSVLVTVRWLY